MSMILQTTPSATCRQGSGQAAAQQLAAACSRPLAMEHGIKPTQLFSRNAEVDAVNKQVGLEFEKLLFNLGRGTSGVRL